MKDEKYVVFKREDWVNATIDPANALDEISDAVVIRKQDIFAGPALHAYASSISTVIELFEGLASIDLRSAPSFETMQRLHEIRDYFFQQALEADDVRTKKVPD